MGGEAGFWTTSGNIALTRVMGVGRQQQHIVDISGGYINTWVCKKGLEATQFFAATSRIRSVRVRFRELFSFLTSRPPCGEQIMRTRQINIWKAELRLDLL